ncbi:MAG: hypothetical protein JJV95_02365 [Sulfurospirillum sp.]|nr:hypothetical protein [Sulfurospirillum sp.]MBL0702817.1 hypothetical protein [Sulfurospirillum sp.]
MAINNGTMNSIAVWWDKQDDLKVHLDVNIWHTKESKNNYLEFGLKITNYKKIDKLHIYIPYDIDIDDIEDKAGLLSSEPSLTKAMFNENLDVTPPSGSFSTVKFHDETIDNFLYCKLDKENDINIKDQIVTLEINKNNKKNINTIYYRFRINKLESIFTESDENYILLDGLFKKNGFLEVNINSVRKLPSSVVDKLSDIKFTSMNLFLMTNNFTNFIFKSEEVKKSRILENHIWEEYLSKENAKDINKIIAYHWKRENFEDYNLFVKISYITKSNLLIGLMILSILSLGAISGVFGNYITKKWCNDFNDMSMVKKTKDINSTIPIIKGDKNETN